VIVFSGSWLRRRARLKAASGEAYGRLLREALSPGWYRDLGAYDTFEGRAAMVTVMTAAACARLAGIGGAEAAALTERINRRVLDGFDAAFREKGVGDHSIARKVRTLAEGHSGLGRALMAAMTADGAENPVAAIAPVLVRNGVCQTGHAAAMAGAILQLQQAFAAQPEAEILAGRFACGGNGPAGG